MPRIVIGNWFVPVVRLAGKLVVNAVINVGRESRRYWEEEKEIGIKVRVARR